MSRHYGDVAPALRHVAITFAASAAAAVANARIYKSLYFGAAGTARIVDTSGHEESIPVVAGGVYPLQSYGVVTGGATTVAAGSVFGLYD